MLTLALHVFNDLDGSLGDVRHILPMRKFTEERRRADDDVNAIHTCKALSE